MTEPAPRLTPCHNESYNTCSLYKQIIIIGLALWLGSAASAGLLTIADITGAANPNTTNLADGSSETPAVTANTSDYGIEITDAAHAGTFTNQGSIALYYTRSDNDGFINVYGIYNTSFTNANAANIAIDNQANITVFGSQTATSCDEDLYSSGIRSDGAVTNSGDISATFISSAQNADLYTTGIRAGGNIINTGDITATAQYTGTSENITAFATGLHIDENGTITNTGTITVSATSNNEAGSIGAACGIAIDAATVTLDSQGLIRTSAAGTTATNYHVYSGASSLSITGYAMEFGDSQAELDNIYEGCIYEMTGGSTSFDNATLYVHTANDFVEGTYEIPTLVTDGTDLADVSDQFANAAIATGNPDYNLVLTNGGGTANQKITIGYDPQASTSQQATQVKQQIAAKSVGIVKQNLMTSLLSASGLQHSHAVASTDQSMGLLSNEQAQAKERSVFLMPYYSHASEESDPMGYDADIYGFSGGVNYRLDEMSIVGFHGGYGYANVDYTGNGYDQRNEKLDVYSAGIHGICRTNDDWVLSGTSTFFYSSNDYHDHTSTNRETADYETLGIETNLSLGYLFKTDCGLIVPEIGLTHLWQHRGAYTTDNLDNADVTHGQMDDNEVYAKLGVTWYGDYHYDQWQLIPSLGIGLEQTLTDGEISNTMTAGTAVETVSDEQDRTAAKLTAGLEFIRDNTSLLVGYSGSYSSNFSESSFYLRLRQDF